MPTHPYASYYDLSQHNYYGSQSASTSTYGKSKFSGKWAFCCNLTALICGLVTFVLIILPVVIILSLAAAGGIIAFSSIENFLGHPDKV